MVHFQGRCGTAGSPPNTWQAAARATEVRHAPLWVRWKCIKRGVKRRACAAWLRSLSAAFGDTERAFQIY